MTGRTLSTAAGPVDVHATVPGSKSLANRALVCAALANGESVVEHLAPGDDTAAMLAGIAALGARVVSDGDRAVITGTGGRPVPGPVRIDARLAGTTSRFLTAMAALGDGPTVIDGEPPLRTRPMAPLHDALRSLGASVRTLEPFGDLPVEVRGPARGGSVSIRGDISSQYLTALVLIGPLFTDGLDLTIVGPLVSRPYVELTIAVMQSFGIDDVLVSSDRIVVPPGRYAPTRYVVEPDASSASYPLALAAVVGGQVRIDGLGHGALQGDARFADVLATMGCTVTRTDADVTVARRTGDVLVGIDVDLADMSDLVPTVAVVAAVAASPSRIRGVGFVRGKESDRLGDLATELRSAGVRIDETEDGLEIHPSRDHLRAARLATHHDHRLAMAFGVLAAAIDGIEVLDPAVVSKSWPGFWSERDRWLTTAPA